MADTTRHPSPAFPDPATNGTQARAIAFILAGMVAISINDAAIKFLSGDYPLHQMVFMRSLIALPFSFAFLWVEGGLSLLRTRTPGLHALRAGLVILANMLFYAGLALLPLAENTALFFIAPLLITLIGIPMLGEQVGIRRIMAILVGFLGVVLMLDLSSSAAQGGTSPWAALLPIGAAVCYAFMQVLTRKLGVSSRASAMAIYIQSGFLVVSGGFYLLVGDGRFAEGSDNPALVFLLRPWIWPTSVDWPFFILLGLFGAVIGICLSQAYRIGNAATVSSYEYVALPLAVLWGWMIWGEIPNLTSMAGILLILGAGLYVFLRERRRNAPLASGRIQRRP